MDAGTEKNLLRTLPSYYNNNHDLNLFLQWLVPLETSLHPLLSEASRTMVNVGDKVLKKKFRPADVLFHPPAAVQYHVYSPFAVQPLLSSQISSGYMFKKTSAGIVTMISCCPRCSDIFMTASQPRPPQLEDSFRNRAIFSPNSYGNSKWALPSVSLANLNSNCDAEDAHNASQGSLRAF